MVPSLASLAPRIFPFASDRTGKVLGTRLAQFNLRSPLQLVRSCNLSQLCIE